MKVSYIDIISATWHSGKSLEEKCVALYPITKLLLEDAENALYNTFALMVKEAGGDDTSDAEVEDMINKAINAFVMNTADGTEIYVFIWAVQYFIMEHGLGEMKTELLKKVIKAMER